MKIFIRFDAVVIHEVELETERVYSIGRDKTSDLRIHYEFISRHHGNIFYKDSHWWFQDLRKDHPRYQAEPQKLLDQIFLETQLTIVTEEFLNTETTKIHTLQHLQQKSNIKYILTLIAVICFAIMTYYFNFRPFTPVEMQNYTKQRFIEFEVNKNKSLESELTAKGLLNDEDFKQTVGFCSGFIVAPQVVMTASHCIMGPDGVTPTTDFHLKSHDGVKHSIDEIIGLDISKDLIIAKVKSLKDYPHFEIASSHEIGEKVYSVGNVHGEGMALRGGTVSSITKDPNNPEIEYIRYTAATSPGNSGGPLVDKRGRVLGLIFARSNAAENYNLAAPYFELEAAITNSEKGKRELTLKTDDIIFGTYLRAKYDKYMLINKALGTNNEFFDPEITESLNKINLKLELPIAFKKFQSELFAKTLEAMEVKISEVTEEMKQEEKLGATWLSHVNKKHPVLIPRNLDPSFLTIDGITDEYLWEKNILIMEPGSYYELTPEDHSYFANAWNNIFEKDMDQEQRSVFPQYLATEINRYFSIFDSPSSAAIIDYSADVPQLLNENRYKQKFQYEDEFLISTNGIDYPFIRPKKMKEFKIRDFKFVPQGEVKDNYQRVWRRSQAVIFQKLILNRYCTDYPQVQICINQPFKGLSDEQRSLVEKQFIKNHLSEKILDLNFWSVGSLAEYLEESPSFEYQDAKISNKAKGRTLIYKFLDRNYIIPSKAKMIKMLPAVLKTDKEKAQWAILGHQYFIPSSSGGPDLLCRSDIDFPELQISHVAKNYIAYKTKLDNLLKQKDRENPENKEQQLLLQSKLNKIKKSTFYAKALGKELVQYQSCKRIIKKPGQGGYEIGELVEPPLRIF